MLAYRAYHGHCRVSTDDAWSCYGSCESLNVKLVASLIMKVVLFINATFLIVFTLRNLHKLDIDR